MKPPYEAVIEGEPVTVSGWDSDGHLVVVDGRRYRFAPLKEPEFDITSRDLLKVSTLKYSTKSGWLVDGKPLEVGKPSLRQAARASWSERLFRLYMLRLVLRQCGEQNEVVAVAWFRDEQEALLLRSFSEIPPNPEVEAMRRQNLEHARLIAQAQGVAKQLQASAKEVKKATEVGDLYSNPSYAAAKDAAIAKKVPKEFVAYCHAEQMASKFPSVSQATTAVETLPLFKALRKGPHSRSTVSLWLKKVRIPLEKRGILTPSGKGPSAKTVPDYDFDRHVADLDGNEFYQRPDERIQDLEDAQDDDG